MKVWYAGMTNLSMILEIIMTFSVRASNNVLQTTLPLLAKYDFFYSEFNVGILIALMSLSGMIAMRVNGIMRGDLRRYSFITGNVV
jgi:hypothetical protein